MTANDYQDDAIDTLAEIDAAPQADGHAVYSLVAGLPAGNKVAHKVYRAPEPGPHERPRSAEIEDARADVPRRLQAFADVCRRLQAFAGVARRPQRTDQ